MKKANFLFIIILIVGTVSCSQVEKVQSNQVRKTNANYSSDKTTINYTRTLSTKQADQIVRLLRKELKDFPQQALPVKYENTTSHSDLNIHLKKNKLKFNYRSKLNLGKENQEVVNIQRIKEKIARI